MRVLKITSQRGVGPSATIEQFEYVLKDEFDDQYDYLEQLIERGVLVARSVELPQNWSAKTAGERQEIAKSQQFNLRLSAIFFDEKNPATKADVLFLSKFSYVHWMKVCGDELDWSDVKTLSSIGRIGKLTISSAQFGDEIVPYLSNFKNLLTLDVTGKKMTRAGADALNAELPNVSLSVSFEGYSINYKKAN